MKLDVHLSEVQKWKVDLSPENTRRWLTAGLMLAQRLRRWSNFKPAMSQRLVFTWSLLEYGHFVYYLWEVRWVMTSL